LGRAAEIREISVDFAGIREADESGVRDELQLEMERLLFSGQAGFDAARRAVGRGDELRVAASAAAALRHEHTVALGGQVRHQRLGSVRHPLEDQRPDRDLDVEIVPRRAGAIGALAVLTAPGFEFRMEAEVDERVLGGGGDDVDRPAVAAVAPVGAAARHELLASEAEAASATVSGRDANVYVIDEHEMACCVRAVAPPASAGGTALLDGNDGDAAAVLAVILEPHFAGTFAKSVSSLPRPTFRPGSKRRPRCRTRIEPPVTTLPSWLLTPSRCELLSRPVTGTALALFCVP
jgi:hypothetical protein